MAGIISQAGVSLQFQAAGQWVADMTLDEQADIFAEDPTLKQRWHPQFGDRKSELVFIGMDMDREEIERDLDACLLTDEEMTADWKQFVDPLPKFVVSA